VLILILKVLSFHFYRLIPVTAIIFIFYCFMNYFHFFNFYTDACFYFYSSVFCSTYISKSVRVRFVHKSWWSPVRVIVVGAEWFYCFCLDFRVYCIIITLKFDSISSIYLPVYNTVFDSINCILSLYNMYLYSFFVVVGSLTFTYNIIFNIGCAVQLA